MGNIAINFTHQKKIRQSYNFSKFLLDYGPGSRKRSREQNLFYGVIASRVLALRAETFLWSPVFGGIDLSLCFLLFSLTPSQGEWAGRTVQTDCSQGRAVPTGTKGWAFSLWKANRGGWWEAMCQGIRQILTDSGSRSALGFLGEPLSFSAFCLQQTAALLPTNAVPEGVQTKGSGYFEKLPQRLSKSFCMFLFLIFMKKYTAFNILQNIK